MSVLEWKSINLLNFYPLEAKLYNIKTEITCICYNNTKKIFADVAGNVHVYSSKWEAITMFQAHTAAIKLCDITSSDINNLLVTVQQNSSNNQIFLQIFDLNTARKREGATCVGSAKINCSSAASVVRIQPIANQICIVIGFERGNFMVYRGQLSRDISSQFRSVNVCLRGIASLDFNQIDPTTFTLFICSYGGIFSYTVTDGNIIADTKNVLDAKNAATSCSNIGRIDGESYFTVGRDDAVYCFTSDGRGPCYGIEGQKQLIAWFGNHLVVVKRAHASLLAQESTQLSLIVVIDVQNKIVVYHKAMRTIVKIIVDNNNCYIVTETNEVYTLVEHDIQSKARLLIKKNLYDVALNMLKGSENEILAEVNMQYGDYLLAKGDISEAVSKYIKTIGYVESYRVIRNLLDSRYNKYLSEYLRVLVNSAFSTPDHLELLRSCTEREDLPIKIKNIFVSDNENCDYTLYDLNSVNNDKMMESTNMNYVNLIELIQHHDLMGKLLSSWSEEHIYDFLTEHWNSINEKHSTDLLIILKSLFFNGQHSFNLAGRFIPLLINNNTACIELLELVIKKWATHDGIITMRSAVVDLYLREWQTGSKSNTEVLRILNEHKQYLNTEDMLLQCKRYKFWEGIMILDERSALRRLCLQHSNSKIDINDWHPETWLEALEENEQLLNNSNKVISNVLKSLLQNKKRSLLQLLRSISDNERITIGQIKDIFTHDHLQNITSSNRLHDITIELRKKLENLKKLLQNYSTRPIEFRSNVCDGCKKQIKSPALYYVCQHVFHEECVMGYSTNKACIVCSVEESSKSSHQQLSSINNESTEILEESNDVIIEAVAKFLSIANTQINENRQYVAGITTSTTNESPKQWQGRFNIKDLNQREKAVKSLNPFDDDDDDDDKDNYDANLNPFSK